MTQAIEFFIPADRADTGTALRDFTARRLSFALRRFEDRVRHITVRFIDVNGPRRGVDSRCSMALTIIIQPRASSDSVIRQLGLAIRADVDKTVSTAGRVDRIGRCDGASHKQLHCMQRTMIRERLLTQYFMYYNFGRVHMSLRVTPAMEAGVTNHVWSVAEIVRNCTQAAMYTRTAIAVL